MEEENKDVMHRSRVALVTALLSCSFALAAPPQPAHPGLPQSAAATAAENRVDINTAPIEQLLKIPGLTRTWAARIIRFRPYRAKNDLIDRGVVTSQVYDRIKEHIIAHRLDR